MGRLTPAERADQGKAARAEVPRESHAAFDPPPDRTDPIYLLEQQAKSRVAELVPVRYGRMMVPPFTHHRGAALPMASDLVSVTPMQPARPHPPVITPNRVMTAHPQPRPNHLHRVRRQGH